MSKVTPPGGAGVDRLTVNVNVLTPLLPSFAVTLLMVNSVQFPNGVPSIFSPGENFRAPAMVVCSTKFPVISGERVNDCALPPFKPVVPPEENCVTRFPEASRTRIDRPPFVKDSPPDEAFTTCAQPKIGSLGLK